MIERLGVTHPPAELEFYISNAQCSLIITDRLHSQTIQPLSEKLKVPFIVIEDTIGYSQNESKSDGNTSTSDANSGQSNRVRILPQQWSTWDFATERKALIVYTRYFFSLIVYPVD